MFDWKALSYRHIKRFYKYHIMPQKVKYAKKNGSFDKYMQERVKYAIKKSMRKFIKISKMEKFIVSASIGCTKQSNQLHF